MTSDTDGNGSGGIIGGSIPRRMVLKIAGLVSILPDAFADTARADTGRPTSQSPSGVDTSGAARRVSLDGISGQHARSVALDGSTALVGMPPTELTAAPEDGQAVLFGQSDGSWRREATLSPEGGSGQFGRAVALGADTAVIGGELGGDPTGGHAGSAAVFEREGTEWSRRATLGAPEADGVDLFGTAVDIAADTLLVGASAVTGDTRRGTGAVFVFSKSDRSWQRTARLVPQTDEIAEFGRAVSIDDDTAVVGARRSGAGPTENGVAVVFRRRAGTWRRQAELEPRDRPRDASFGTQVAMQDETIIVGAPTETNTLGTNAGAAYVFVRRKGRWRRQASLRPSTRATAHRFGSDITLDGNVALIGTTTGGGPSMFVRTDGQWAQVATLRPDDSAPETGAVVAIDEGRALVGITEEAPVSERTGRSVEVFEL